MFEVNAMNTKRKAYIVTLALVAILTVYWAGTAWWANRAPSAPTPSVSGHIDEHALRQAMQDLLLSEDTQLLLTSLLPAPSEGELATNVGNYLLRSGQLQQIVREVMLSAQFKDTIVTLVQEPEVQQVIKASIELEDIQFMMEELLSTPEGQAFIVELLTGLFSPSGNS